MKIGYAYAPLTINAQTNKKIVSKHFSNEDFINCFRENLVNLKEILAHNINNEIYNFRISSDILDNLVQYNSEIQWTSLLKNELLIISNLINKNNIRITMFPQKYTILNSPNEDVVKKSITFLETHVEFMEALKLDASNKIILEIGGVYTNKTNATKRFIDSYNSLSTSIKERLVLINDSKNFSFEDTIAICNLVKAPFVLDTIADSIFPSSIISLEEKLLLIEKTWEKTTGNLLIHYAQQKHNARKGEISDTIFTNDFIEFYKSIKTLDCDVTLDSNDGDISVLKCLNIIKELNGYKFDSSQLIHEYKKYKLLILEKGFDADKNSLSLANLSNSIISFYSYIDSILESFIDNKGFVVALREALKIIVPTIKPSEKNHIEKLILNNKFKRCKTYMHEVAIRNNSKDLLDTYFFSQK
ncbi:MAG: hypothetical protein ACRC57_06710 [Sarcina sp.]